MQLEMQLPIHRSELNSLAGSEAGDRWDLGKILLEMNCCKATVDGVV